MAVAVAPVELPTDRRSYFSTAPGPDIHDPNWIPVLSSARYEPTIPSAEKEALPLTSGSFSLFPNQPQSTSPRPRAPLSHNYSKSSLAPESLASDSRSQNPGDNVEPPLPNIQQTQSEAGGHHRRKTSLGSRSTEEKISVGTETPTGDVVSAPSTEGSASIVGGRPFLRQEQHEDIKSTTTSTSSSKKLPVLPPTSKYNRKPVASMAASIGRPSFVLSLPQTPQESPRISPSVAATTPSTPLVQPVLSPNLLPTELPLPPPPPQPESVPKLQPAKSSASERRQRALHSHPSNISLQSPRDSSSDDAEIPFKPPSLRKPRKSTDSRATSARSTIYDAQMPTPAPTTPLPQLPPEARRPPTRENNASQNSTPALANEPFLPTTPTVRPSEHSEIASFMTEKNTLVFRRFDDVHVRLLLCLQSEISQLEKELSTLGSSTSQGVSAEKMAQTMRVLRELRRVVAEYDHLFTTWSKMQANKASESTTKELKQWLHKPGTNAQAGLGIEMGHDLQWLEENKNDLSSIDFNEKEDMLPKEAPQTHAGPSNSGGPLGFLALFGCGAKRK
ncbi:hypothetical protein LTR67_008226 [Exophiala xenobiotica]